MKHLALKELFHEQLKDFTTNEVNHIWNSVSCCINAYIKAEVYSASEKYRDEIDELEWEKEESERVVDELKEEIRTLQMKLSNSNMANTLQDELKMQWVCENWDKIPTV